MTTLYLAWQDPKGRSWFPVGQLSFNGQQYRFVYTEGAKEAPNFRTFGMMTELDTVYESTELFPLFANRLLAEKRPEYKDFLTWLNIKENEADPISLLARSEGRRETDSLTLFACPERDGEGNLKIHFFSHGIRYLEDQVVNQINNLKQGERLCLMPDIQNESDQFAIALRTDVPATIVGYCPRFLAKTFRGILEKSRLNAIDVSVERVNKDAPIQLRLLCKLSAPWPKDFEPCSDKSYQPLAGLGDE